MESNLPDQRSRRCSISGNEAWQVVTSRTGELKDPAAVRESYEEAFHYRQEDPQRNARGLREPQLGAVHAVLGHWGSRRMQPATVVMPTGTGKTDTMVALLVAGRIQRLLVIVPSDALRDQTAVKFERLGVLHDAGVVDDSAHRPVVGRIKHGMKDADSAREFASHCNVIIATPPVMRHFSPEAKDALYRECTHLFLDEAHHVAAATWREIRDQFTRKHVVQFTATPFRSDGADLGGRFVFGFSLKDAHHQGYFSKIRYAPVADLFEPDRAIAERAVELLRGDLDAGHDHILMARVNRIGRAEDVVNFYRQLAPNLNPVILHSNGRKRDLKAAREALDARASRIVVCVDMLGEGFDLPALKIAAIHDQHKSLGITLQFIGRFARVGSHAFGPATVVVNRTETQYDENLKKLYAEDADWNDIIEILSADAVGEQEELDEFEAAFSAAPEEISLRNIAPRMSTVVYRTSGLRWTPEALTPFFGDRLLTSPIAVNERDRVAWLVAREHHPVRWGTVKALEDVSYDLYVLYWDRARGLLYINSSNTDSVHEDLAKAVAGADVTRIRGMDVYRIMSKIQRCVPTNVGTLDSRNRSRRFQMAVGADVLLNYPEAERRTKSQTNIFVSGYEGGDRVYVGASLKGRVWNYGAAPTLRHWVTWCDDIGTKITDETVDPAEVLKGFIKPTEAIERPDLVPLAIEWPIQFFLDASDKVEIKQGRHSWPLIDADLTITTFTRQGPIGFDLRTPHWRARYEITITGGHATYTCDGPEPTVEISRRPIPFSEYIARHGLRILFEDETVLQEDMFLISPEGKVPPFSPDRLLTIDWTGVNLKKESQGEQRDPTSIQARTIQHLLGQADWDLIVDDDGPGEAADVVAVRIDGDELHINLVHCKYAHGTKPGARVSDLYEVCGQVHKSTKWRYRPTRLFEHLIRRERHRRGQGRTGLEKGTDQTLLALAQKTPQLKPRFTLTIVQPGLSKAKVSEEQLHLLACAEVYAAETADSIIEVIVNT